MIDYDRLLSDRIRKEYISLLNPVRESGKKNGKEKRVETSDSGYVSENSHRRSLQTRKTKDGDCGIELAQDDREENGNVRDLHEWILEPFSTIFSSLSKDSDGVERTVYEWFHSPARFFTLTCSESGTLDPEEESDTDGDLTRRMDQLVPSLQLPKYLTQRSLPVFYSSELTVRQTSSTPSPEHPCLVSCRASGQEYFLKLIDPDQPGPVKRELRILQKLDEKNLYEKINAPRLLGVVLDSKRPSIPTSGSREEKDVTRRDKKCNILGFLLTPIPNSTPLSLMLDSDTIDDPSATDKNKTNREVWLDDMQKYIAALHSEGLIWGDVKPDNFLIDGQGKIWMIDFGGSYTEGWVDEELNETLEGDEQGMKRTIEAVRNPEEFFSEDEHDHERKKRKINNDDDDDAGEKTEKEEEKKREELYCYCNMGANGRMIACDDENCKKEWFHMECTGMDEHEIPDEKG